MTSATSLPTLATQPHTHAARRRDLALSWSALSGALTGLALILLAYQAITDDGYITLALARNVALRGEWAVTPGLLSNTATSPLYVLALAAVTAVTRAPVMSLGIVLMASQAATALLTSLVARRYGWSWWAGPIVAVLLASSPLMASTLGLESFLLIALLVGLLYAVACARPGWVGVACGLVVLCRPDAAVFAVLALVALVALVAVVRPVSAGQVVRTVLIPPAVAAAVVAPWAVASIAMFDTWVPDTLIWKTAQKQGLGGTYYGDALPLFFDRWPAATALSVGLVALGGIALLVWLLRAPLHPVTIVIGLGGVAHSALMTALVVPPFTWYYAPTTACAALLVAVGLAAAGRTSAVDASPLEQRSRRLLLTRIRLGVLAAPVVVLVAGCVAYANAHDYAVKSSPFHANYATAQQYAQLADRVPSGSVLQTSHGEVGALAYYCDTRCTVVDPLSDRGRLSPLIETALQAPGVKGDVLRLLYAGWKPSEPVPAQLQTVVSDHGTPVWSGFGGPGWLDVVPMG